MGEIVVPSGGALMRTSPSDDFNKYIQEMKELIKSFSLYLDGYQEARDNNGDIILIKVNEPKINEAGKAALINYLNSYLNPNTYMAYIKTADTKNNYLLDVDDIYYNMAKNHKTWALTRKDAEEIAAELCRMSFMALRKAETDKKFIFPQINTNYTPTGEMQQRKGLFGGLFG